MSTPPTGDVPDQLSKISLEDLKVADQAPEEVKPKEPRPGAETIALQLGIIKQAEIIGDAVSFDGKKMIQVRGRKALKGQYTVPIMSEAQNKAEHGEDKPSVQIGKRDMSEVINAHLGMYGKPRRMQPL